MSPQVAAINSNQPVRLQATKAPDQTQIRHSNLKDVAPYMSPQVAAINSNHPVRLQATKAPDKTQIRHSNLKDVGSYMSPQVAAINSNQPVRLQATKAPDQTQSRQTPQASIEAQPLAPKESQSPLLVVVLPTGPAQNVQGALSNSNTQLSKELVVVEKLVSGRVPTSNINFKTLASQRTPLPSQQSQQHRITTTATKMSHQNATQKSTKS
jgi:hypothetical protein